MKRGFTLIELLVVIAIIALLSSIVLASISSSTEKARNVVRRSDLLAVQQAAELYYADHGHYPITNCTMYMSEPGNPEGGGATYPSDGDYVPGLSPDYMGSLPHDPRAKRNDAYPCNGNWVESFSYLSNYDGSGYNVILHCGPEGTWDSSDSMYDPVRPYWGWKVSGGNVDDLKRATGCSY